MTAFALPQLHWLNIPTGHVSLADGKGDFDVQPFRIARYPVTNAQFEAFIEDSGYRDDRWWADAGEPNPTPEDVERGVSGWRMARERLRTPREVSWPDADCPRTDLCWYEAVAFTRWLSAKSGMRVRLPTEWEWQWAAAGETGWDYPFGPAFDADKCNSYESGIARTTPVTQYAGVKTAFGTADMSGNVLEWCLNENDVNPATILTSGTGRPAIRGGSWGHDRYNCRVTFRLGFNALNSSYAVGFRLAADM